MASVPFQACMDSFRGGIVERQVQCAQSPMHLVESAAPSGSSRLHSSMKQEAQLMLTNQRDAFRGQSRSPNIVPFHMSGIVSSCAIVTLSLRRTVFPTFDFKNIVTLKSVSEVTQGQ